MDELAINSLNNMEMLDDYVKLKPCLNLYDLIYMYTLIGDLHMGSNVPFGKIYLHYRDKEYPSLVYIM